MNETTMSTGSRKTRQRQPPRPRSGSWGTQELAYYKSFEHPSSSSSSYPSKFLSMGASRTGGGQHTAGAVAGGMPGKRPPLPLEMVHPEHLLSTPVQSATSSIKKRSTRIRSISQFFKSLSSSKPATTTPSKSSLSVDTRHQERNTAPRPSQQNKQEQKKEEPTAGSTVDQQNRERFGAPSAVDEFILKPTPNINKRLPRCPTFHGSPIASKIQEEDQPRPPLLRRKTSEDDSIQRESSTKKTVDTPSYPAYTNVYDDNPDDDGDVDVPLDLRQAQESLIAGDRLSKRLSGGHFGSAGGLLISTTPPAAPAAAVDMDTTPPPSDLSSPVTTQGNDEYEEQLAADSAKRIWEEDPTVYHDMEHIAEWIGNGKPLSTSILKHYFGYFDFTNQRLDEAFRKFCSKLHLKAETQQIDRVLEGFAHRYWDCNTLSILGNPDVVHAIVYSLLLLNTDLHVAQGDHRKMSQNAFVRNTLSAVLAHLNDHDCATVDVRQHRSSSFLSSPPFYESECDEEGVSSSSLLVNGASSLGSKAWLLEIEALLREMYTSIRHRQISDPFSAKTDESSSHNSRRRSLQITSGRVGAFKRSVGTIMWKSATNTARDSMVITEMAEPTDSAIATSPVSSFHRRRSMSSLKSSLSQTSHLGQPKSTAPPLPPPPSSTAGQQQQSPSSEVSSSTASAAPYYKEGVLVRKHLLERAGQKARHRDWKECFLVADRGEVRMYKPENDHRKSMVLSRNSVVLSRNHVTAEGLPAAGGAAEYLVMVDDWQSHAELAGTIDLKHTLANTLPSGYSRQRPYAFALQQPSGGVYLFQVASAEEAVEWVTTCNYWAARESKEPLMGGVSNIEYGWGNCLEDDDSNNNNNNNDDDDDDDSSSTASSSAAAATVIVHEWKPPIPPTVQSTLDEQAQLASLHRHVQALNEALDQHRDLKRRTEVQFPLKTNQATRAMTNWENKSQYLLHEIIKYQNYCDAIERSLALQAKASSQGEDDEDEE